MVVVVAVAFVFATGVSYAQGPPSMPEKVRNALEKFIGTWTIVADGDLEGTEVCRWDPSKSYVVGEISATMGGESVGFGTRLSAWDGVSEDGIFSYIVSRDFHQSVRIKIVSDTVMEGDQTGIFSGKERTGKSRYVFQGPDRFTFVAKDSTPGGEPEPDWTAVFTRVKTDAPKPSPEMKKREVLVGDWTYKGEQADPDVAGVFMGPAGKYSGRCTIRFVLDGSFQETKWQDEVPAVASGVIITGYDAKAKNYVATDHISDGSRSVATATLDGRIWKSNSTMTTGKGEKVLVKSVDKYSPDWASYTSTVEVSKDGGKTWKIWYTEEGKKVKK